jgi:hypothetical protein
MEWKAVRGTIKSATINIGLWALIAWGLSVQRVPAQESAPPDWKAAIEGAKAQFKPITPGEVATAKVELAASVAALENWLVRSGAPIAEGWKKYLGWSDLENVVASEQPPSEDVVNRLLAKLTANEVGLERKQFTRTRAALARYAAFSRQAASDSLPTQYASELDSLATHLEAYTANPAAGDEALAVGRSLAWLADSGQAGELVSTVRQQFSGPNLHASVSQRLAAVGIERDVDQVTGVRDNILGTDIRGSARMVGRTSLALVDNPEAATLNILLAGNAYSNSMGYNGPVTVHTTGVTGIAGTKQLQMTGNGLVAFRAAANARTRSTIHSLTAKHRLIEKIGWKRAGQQKSQSEAIASNRAAARVAAQMDQEAAGMVAEQNERFLEKVKYPLMRRNAIPEEMTFSTAENRIFVRMLQAATGRLAAPSAPPEHAETHDIAVRVHESLSVNLGEAILAGIELTDVEIEKLIKDDLKADLPEELRVTLDDGTLDPDKEPWSIIFARELPLRAQFQDGGLKLAIRAEGFTRGEGEEPGKYKPALSELVEIGAQYKIEKTDVGATLRREGDVIVRFPNRENPDQITIRDNPIVAFMRRKFRNLYKEEFVGEGIQLKDRWAEAGTLRLAELQSGGAWLTLGWQMPADAPALAPSAAASAESVEAVATTAGAE